MKKLIFVLTPIFIFNLLFADSTDEAKMQIGLQGNMNYYFAFMDDNDYDGIFSPGIDAFFDMKLGKKFAVNISAGYNQIKIDYPTELTNNMLCATIKGKYFLFKSKKLSPFIDLGIGAFSFSQDNGYFDDSKTSTRLIGGVGAEIPISNKFNLIPAIDYSITQDDIDHLPNNDDFLDDEYMTVSLGFSYKFGGPKEEAVVPEPVEIEKPAEPVQEEVVEEPVEVEEVVEEVEAVEEVAPVVEEEVVEEAAPEVYETMEYMIKKGDNLSVIAEKIYGTKSDWKNIYDWNKESIGSNPNLIYPYYQLNLQNVSPEQFEGLKYTLYEYEVKAGETLRSIAAREYGSSYAWVVIFRDNQDVLGDSYNAPAPGTVIKLRDNLFNK